MNSILDWFLGELVLDLDIQRVFNLTGYEGNTKRKCHLLIYYFFGVSFPAAEFPLLIGSSSKNDRDGYENVT